MKKSILNIGKALSKAEQKSIHGGAKALCATKSECEGPYGLSCPDGECVLQSPPPHGSGCYFCDHRHSD